MYIEVVHDQTGNIAACYCADTLPVDQAAPLFRIEGGLPAGYEQARVNIDTLTAMEIERACGLKAVIDPVTQAPAIINIERADHVRSLFRVDVSKELSPPGAALPQGMKMHGLTMIQG